MEMFTAPIKDELEDVMELCEGGVTADQETPPNERTDTLQDDTKLIDIGQCVRWFHAWSVTRRETTLKGAPGI